MRMDKREERIGEGGMKCRERKVARRVRRSERVAGVNWRSNAKRGGEH